MQIQTKFIDRVKLESGYHNFLEEDLILQLIDFFDKEYSKQNSTKNIKDPLDMALNFYKDYNLKYYELLLDALQKKEIIIDDKFEKSYIETETNKALIKLQKNDTDIFILVHEFAHFIDRNSTPKIIPDKFSFLCEVFSFFMEKKLEGWLPEKLNTMIQIRRNSRMYFEAKMMKAIKYELYYEKKYKETGTLDLNELDNDKIKLIMGYDYDLEEGLINYLLRYPLANILSDELISKKEDFTDHEIFKICLNTNLYELLKNTKIDKI